MPFLLQNVTICHFCRETLTYDVFGPNNLGIRARRFYLLVILCLEKRPHISFIAIFFETSEMGKDVENIKTGNETVGIYTVNVLPVKLVSRETSENCEPSEPSVFSS